MAPGGDRQKAPAAGVSESELSDLFVEKPPMPMTHLPTPIIERFSSTEMEQRRYPLPLLNDPLPEIDDIRKIVEANPDAFGWYLYLHYIDHESDEARRLQTYMFATSRLAQDTEAKCWQAEANRLVDTYAVEHVVGWELVLLADL